MPVATYDQERDRWAFLYDSYRGGRFYRSPSSVTLGTANVAWNTPAPRSDGAITESGAPVARSATVRSYLTPHPEESDTSFNARHSLGAHVPIVTPVVKAYAEAVTQNVTRTGHVVPASTMRDVTRRGHDWESWVDECARFLALFGLGFAVCDTPQRAPGVVTTADEAAIGARPYTIFVQPTAVALVETDEWGRITRFVWADEPYYPRESTAKQSTYGVCLREWSMDAHLSENGKRTPGWRRVKGALTIGQTAAPVAEQLSKMEVLGSGPLPPQLLGRLPVVVGYYEPDSSSTTPQGISLVDDVADIERLIYNVLSWCTEIHRAAGFPFLAVPMGKTGGHMDPAVSVTLGPARGLGFDSSTGDPHWIQPSAESTKELREHCGFLFQLALRSAGLELASDSSAQVQSGEALRIRSRDFDSRCSRFARQMAGFETEVLRLLGMLAGSGDPGDALVVQYATRFTLPDPSEDLARAVTLLGLRSTGVDIGDAATVEVLKQALVAALPMLSTEVLDKIVTELQQRYAQTTQFQAAAMARDAEMGAAQVAAAKASAVANGEVPPPQAA